MASLRATMKDSLSSPLSRHLASRPAEISGGLSAYVATGADFVSPADMVALRQLLPQVRAKASAVKDSVRLRKRVELLADFVVESSASTGPAQREAAFALYYFLKGYDLVPDSVPDVGLLDDALVVEAALRRNEHTLRAHWAQRHRAWPNEA